MEKLIVEVQYGDCYTFNAVATYPVLFSSKEEFIISLEDKVKNIQSELKNQQKVEEEYQEKINKKLNQIKEKNKPSENEQITKDLAEYNNEYQDLNAKRKSLENFNLGGQCFDVYLFIQYTCDTREEYIEMPEVYTLEEYFKTVEENILA